MKLLSTVTNRPRLITAAIFGALALNVGAVSLAGDASDVPQAVVQFSDLDLANAVGAATLYMRIDAAAHKVCQPYDAYYRDDYLEMRSHALQKACVHNAIAGAVKKVGSSELFTVYNAMSGRNR